MSGGPHVVVDVSANGFGHLAQVAPILTRLAERNPGTRLTLRTEIDPLICAQFFAIPFEIGPPPPDPNMRMRGPLDVDSDGLFADYVSLFENWDSVLDADSAVLASLSPDLLVTNIAVASIASAKAVSLPTAAICSLNWADVFDAYCGDRDGSGEIFERMTAIYSLADLFLQLSPHLPMDWLPAPRSVGPVARTGIDRRDALRACRQADFYVLASMGGIPGLHSALDLPRLPGVVWITPPDWKIERADVISRRGLDIDFIDLMRSVDAIVTKAGYGSVTEAACNGTRILYTDRTNWCETPVLEEWMKVNCTALKVAREDLQSGAFGPALATLLAVPSSPAIEITGVVEAVTALEEFL